MNTASMTRSTLLKPCAGMKNEDGKACEVDFPAAYEWAEKAALQGLVHAQKRVSAFLSLGKGVARDLQKSAYWEKEFLIREAKEGSMAALFHLGNFLIQGRPGYPKDSAKAIAYYTKSAQGGYKDSMLKLASIYEKGIETRKDEAAAISWYEQAGYGDHPAANRLRRIIALSPRCEKGEKDAQYELGGLLGVNTDEGEALLQAAVRQGHLEAARLLFEFYSTADSGRSITPAQHQWIVRAAELGVAQAQHFLAMTANIREEKLSWLRKAADQGYQPAKDELDKIESAPESSPSAAEPDDMISRLGNWRNQGMWSQKSPWIQCSLLRKRNNNLIIPAEKSECKDIHDNGHRVNYSDCCDLAFDGF